MRFHLLRKMTCLPVLALMLAPAVPLSAAASNAAPLRSERQLYSSQAEALDLLKDVRALSGKLAHDADILESYKWQSNLHWESHSYRLHQARDHINAIGKRLAQLDEIRPQAAPWQQRAIDELTPIAARVAAHTQAAMEHLKDNHGYLFAPVYTDRLSAIRDHSVDLKESADAFLAIGDTMQRLDHLQLKLDDLQEKAGLIES